MILKMYLVLVLAVVTLSQCRTYENYKVYRLAPDSDIQVQILNDLRKNGYQFWEDFISVGNEVKVMVSPEQNEKFVAYTKTVGINPELTISDVQEVINAQLQPARTSRVALGNFTWNQYHPLTTIHAWLDELEQLYPDVVQTVIAGYSVEGRPIKGVIIDFKSGDTEATPLIAMIEGGIHSREWISPATVTWFIKEFLTSTDADIRLLAKTFVWHIFPVVNPDGYDYTFTGDRMWRKNRNPANHVPCGNNDDLSNGIDLNRNFDFGWMSIGASDNPCDQTYAGPSPASEPETRAISNYVQQLKADGEVIYYFAFHSYSQMVLIPFSHAEGTQVLDVGNYADLYEVSIRGAEKLEATNGAQYTVGTSAEILYAVSGSSFDWVKGVADVPIVLLFELRDVGQYGFLLLPEQIIPNNVEIMNCLVAMDKTTRILGYYSSSRNIFGSIIAIVANVLILVMVR